MIISLFETVRLSVSISPRNLYNSLKSIKEIPPLHLPFSFNCLHEPHSFAKPVARQRKVTYSRVAAVASSRLFTVPCACTYMYLNFVGRHENNTYITSPYQIKDVVASQDIITVQSKTIMPFGELQYHMK